ncbi:MAG: FtsQ-type POTRA domain-containing protein [Chloroflexi bacterium]|nr:FtsQ-type POTRA domain-containing protein [Chloroflexota bacterium]MBI2758007.1 FtsQ-type POTRA domain-containing protein [Chloroflexota bacterium]
MSEKRELSRAEMVRLRRRRESQKRQTQSMQRAVRPLPNVTSRNFTAPNRTANPSTRRRFQAAFAMPGIQVQMPSFSLPRFKAGWRLLSFFLSLLFGTALYLAWTLPTFQVVAADVTGNQRISADEINAVLSSTGQPIFTLQPADLATRLRLNYPELASATVTVSLPNILTVNVVERQPVILWQFNGGYTWIDNQGVAFRPRGAAQNIISVTALAAPAPGLPSETDALSPVPYLSMEMVKAITTLAPSVPAGTPMIYDANYGLGWTDSRGWQVFFGNNGKDMILKLQVYQALVTSLTGRGITPAFISVQYVNTPYYRMSR